MYGQTSIGSWVSLYCACHDGEGRRLAWPDGGNLLSQQAIVVAMFDIVGAELRAYASDLSKRGGGH